jgi:hypothetical protein
MVPCVWDLVCCGLCIQGDLRVTWYKSHMVQLRSFWTDNQMTLLLLVQTSTAGHRYSTVYWDISCLGNL